MSSMYEQLPVTWTFKVDRDWYWKKYIPAVYPVVTHYLADVLKHDKALLATYGTNEIVIVLADEYGTHTHGTEFLKNNPGYFRSLTLNTAHRNGKWLYVKRRGPVFEITPEDAWNIINKRTAEIHGQRLTNKRP